MTEEPLKLMYLCNWLVSCVAQVAYHFIIDIITLDLGVPSEGIRIKTSPPVKY
jgi:hypothetical protein